MKSLIVALLFMFTYTKDVPLTSQEALPLPLQAISVVESHAGQDIDHKVLKHGANKGLSAIGFFGLLPTTIVDIIQKTPSLSKYASISHIRLEDVAQYMDDHPELEFRVARELYVKLHKRYHGDLSKVFYCWLNGSVPPGMSEEAIKSHWYSMKVDKIYRKLLKLQAKPKILAKR